MSIGRIVTAERDIFSLFPDNESGNTVWDVPVTGGNPTIRLEPINEGVQIAPTVVYILRQCIVSNFGASADSTGQFVQENIQLMFGSMITG